MSATHPVPALSLRAWRADSLVEPLAAGEVRVLTVDLEPREQGDEELERFPEFLLLTEEERARARRFVRPRDRRRFTICRGSLRLILGRLVDRPPEVIAFRSGPGGKPELAPECLQDAGSALRFNVTHSGELALIAVAADRELGVDVERLRPIGEAERIVGSYFTTAERAIFLALEPGERETAFLRGWTRKEAVLKAKGVGLAGLATGFETMFGDAPLSERFAPAMPRPRVGGWDLWEASPTEGYVAALAVAAPTESR